MSLNFAYECVFSNNNVFWDVIRNIFTNELGRFPTTFFFFTSPAKLSALNPNESS